MFCLVLFVYAPSLSSSFIWDDDDYVTENSTLRSLGGLQRIWIEPSATPQYYPLVFTTFWVEQHLWGLNPTGYHLVNAFLHAANAVGVWLILRRLGIPGSWFAAALFGLHPVHVESVAWVTERKNVLSAAFYLLSLWQFLAWVERKPNEDGTAGPVPVRSYVLGYAFFICALLSKSVTCSLPAVLVLLRLWKAGRLRVRELTPIVPLFAIGAASAWNTAWLERAHVGASGTAFSWSFAERFLIAGRALWAYAASLVWPVHLSFISPRWTVDSSVWWAWALALAAVALPVALLAYRRRITGPVLALLFFAGTLLPALGFFNIFPMRYAFVADHYQYLASSGLLALVAAWWLGTGAVAHGNWRIFSPTAFSLDVRRAIAGCVLVGLAVLTWQRQAVFHDSTALWSDTLTHDPTSMIANIQMGRLAAHRQDYAAAEGYLRDGIRYRTDDLETHEFETNLAHVLSAEGRFDEATVEFKKALALRPDYPEALNGLANVAARQKNFAAAIDLYRQSLAAQPHNAVIRTNLANALVATGEAGSAEREYRVALEADSQSISPRLGLALLWARAGNLSRAEAECLEILQLEPRNAAATRLLARIRVDRRIARPHGVNNPRG